MIAFNSLHHPTGYALLWAFYNTGSECPSNKESCPGLASQWGTKVGFEPRPPVSCVSVLSPSSLCIQQACFFFFFWNINWQHEHTFSQLNCSFLFKISLLWRLSVLDFKLLWPNYLREQLEREETFDLWFWRFQSIVVRRLKQSGSSHGRQRYRETRKA